MKKGWALLRGTTSQEDGTPRADAGGDQASVASQSLSRSQGYLSANLADAVAAQKNFDRRGALEKCPLVTRCSADFIRKLVPLVSLSTYAPGVVVCTEGDEADALMICTAGSAVSTVRG